MDTLAEVRDTINKANPTKPVKIDWGTMSITSDYGVIELYPGCQWVVDGKAVKTSQFKKMFGMNASERELWLEKLQDMEQTGYVAEKAVPAGLIYNRPKAQPIISEEQAQKNKEEFFAEPVKKERKKRAPMSEEQRKAASERLVKARAARKAKRSDAEASNEGGISEFLK